MFFSLLCSTDCHADKDKEKIRRIRISSNLLFVGLGRETV